MGLGPAEKESILRKGMWIQRGPQKSESGGGTSCNLEVEACGSAILKVTVKVEGD